MKLLLDTHVFIWYVENDPKIPESTKEKIQKQDNEIILSIASLWEIGIKTSLKKLELNVPMVDLTRLIYNNGFELLPILPEHIVMNSQLKFYHRDPFDRMIIAQGLTENIAIISKDALFDQYEVKRYWK